MIPKTKKKNGLNNDAQDCMLDNLFYYAYIIVILFLSNVNQFHVGITISLRFYNKSL